MKLSRIVTGVLSVALLAFMVSDTLGQEDGRRRGRPGGFQRGPGAGGPGFGRGGGGPGRGGDMTMTLLRIEEVRTELQISPDQEEALTKLAEQSRGERPEGIDFRSMSDEERREFFEKRQKEQEERMTKVKEQLEEVLFPEQMERLEEIELQVRGVQALTEDDVVSKLKITEAQQKELADVRDQLQQKMRDKMREVFASGDREAMREAFGKIREEMQEMEGQVLAVLTTDQRKQFDQMKGEPFEMPEGAFGRAGFGGGRGGPPGGGPGFRGRGGDRGGPGGGRRGRPEAEN